MYKNHKIVYKNIQIENLETIKQILIIDIFLHKFMSHPSFPNIRTTNSTIIPKLMDLIRKETILFQQLNLFGKTASPFFQRNYSFQKMLQTEDVLELLDFLETVKYSANYTSARKILHKYLYSNYDLSSCTLLKTKKDDTLNLGKYNDSNIHYNSNLLSTPEDDNQSSPSKTIRQHLVYFLTTIMNSYGNFDLFKKFESPQESKASGKLKERFYIPAYEIPAFLLLFTYFDGRDFQYQNNQKNKNHLPQYNIERSCSEFSYQLVKERLKALCPSFPLTQSSYPALDISTFKRCDNIFLFTKLNRLTYYYNLYLSDPVLTMIMQKYNLTYLEVTELDKFLIKTIFEDEDFIIKGLRSSYADFLLPFDILFRSAIFLNPSGQSSFSTFKSELNTIKDSTIKLLYSNLFYTPNLSLLSFCKSGDLYITDSEEKILKYLSNDDYYKNCYCFNGLANKNSAPTNTVTHKYSLEFNIIKKALDIPQF